MIAAVCVTSRARTWRRFQKYAPVSLMVFTLAGSIARSIKGTAYHGAYVFPPHIQANPQTRKIHETKAGNGLATPSLPRGAEGKVVSGFIPPAL